MSHEKCNSSDVPPKALRQKARSTVILHTAATIHNRSAFLFKLIDASIWLLLREPDLSSVNIVIHPLIGVTSIRDLRIRWHNRIIRNPVQSLNSFIKRVANKGRTEARLQVTKEAIFWKVFNSNNSVSLVTSAGRITIRRANAKLATNFFAHVGIYNVARKLRQSVQTRGLLNAQAFLQLSYRGVHIGDLVGSQALRNYPSAGGSINECQGLWPTLLLAVGIIDYINKLPDELLENSCVVVPDASYLPGLYKRALAEKGANILELHHYSEEFLLVSQPAHEWNPKLVNRQGRASLTASEREKVQRYFEERMATPERHLPYMTVGVNHDDPNVRDIHGRLIDFQPSGNVAVLYLHSFDDGQYWYGIDGFDDIYHWTTYTIEELLKNTDVDKVLIKPHPNVDYIEYPGDRIAMTRLTSHYQGLGKLVFLSKAVSAQSLLVKTKFLGITHHGSVAEELAFLNVPVIASAFAPWGKSYDFLHTWSNPLEYRQLLTRFKDLYSINRSIRCAEELGQFILDYRLNVMSQPEKTTWIKYARFKYGCLPKNNLREYRTISNEMGILKESDGILQEFLESLVRSHGKTKAKS
jgi:hypothetical protein